LRGDGTLAADIGFSGGTMTARYYGTDGTTPTLTDIQAADGTRTTFEYPASGHYTSIRQDYDAGGVLVDLYAHQQDGSNRIRGFRDGVTLTAQAGATDTFVHYSGDGNATVRDFLTGTGAAHDVLEVEHGFFANDDYTTGLQQAGSDVLLTGTNGERITLAGVLPGQLAAADFSFV
jgi:hypothetical protein